VGDAYAHVDAEFNLLPDSPDNLDAAAVAVLRETRDAIGMATEALEECTRELRHVSGPALAVRQRRESP
jgi:hypothetical protein